MGNNSSTICEYEERIRILEKRVLELEQKVFLNLDINNNVNYISSNQRSYVKHIHQPQLTLINPNDINSV